MVLVSYEHISPEVAKYYAEHLLDMLEAGSHGYDRLIVYTSFELDPIATQDAEGILKENINPVAQGISIEVQVRTLPTGLNR
ncbi:hypothetical protein [Alicyclobacillus contaminans]|uniref:hypothetical protein n=1 Tax=Alicyclobacillus contaminans TaxID=392016 RepID=UPI0012EBE781|nr:hypothetical protein [Alicyclobacillus contaminans]